MDFCPLTIARVQYSHPYPFYILYDTEEDKFLDLGKEGHL